MPPETTASAFSFICPRCDSLLEAQRTQAGQVGRCPTCAARFTIPKNDPQMNGANQAELLDPNRDDPTPMHAYAASGRQAPQIRRNGDGTLSILCPRCGTNNAISADGCASCGTPFTLEGGAMRPVPDPASRAALAIGIVSLPLFAFVAPSLLAIVLGLVGWWRQKPGRAAIDAAIGLALGVLSLALAMLVYL